MGQLSNWNLALVGSDTVRTCLSEVYRIILFLCEDPDTIYSKRRNVWKVEVQVWK